jgi:hypothetical protein
MPSIIAVTHPLLVTVVDHIDVLVLGSGVVNTTRRWEGVTVSSIAGGIERLQSFKIVSRRIGHRWIVVVFGLRNTCRFGWSNYVCSISK